MDKYKYLLNQTFVHADDGKQYMVKAIECKRKESVIVVATREGEDSQEFEFNLEAVNTAYSNKQNFKQMLETYKNA